MEKLCDTDLTARRFEGACAIAFSPDIQLLQTIINNDRAMGQSAASNIQNRYTVTSGTTINLTNAQAVMIIPTAAAVITARVAQPKYLRSGGFTRLPMTLWLLVRRMTSTIRGGARRPLITADQNSIFTALKPK